MLPSTTHELAEALRHAELLTRAQTVKLAELVPNLSDDPRELAFALVQRGWLTSYQAEQVLLGNAPLLVLGGYVLLAPLGSGGMGQVFKALQKRLNRTVALKAIRPELIDINPGAIRRFKREALAVAQLSHPNIVAIYDADEAGGTHFIVLEYVDGPDLERMVMENGALPVAQAVDYVRQAALGLQHAFEAGLVHRDIKPGNLLIASSDAPRPRLENSSGWAEGNAHGRVKILDMGLARMESVFESKASLTREGVMMGTPDYIAPEQARDASSVDIRADIYSLGCTMYFMLTGRPPFPDGTMIEKLMKHQQADPAPIESLRADVPSEVISIISRMMAKEPALRFQTPIEVATALARVLELQPASRDVGQINEPAPLIRPTASAPEAPVPVAAYTHSSRSDTPPESSQQSAVTVVTAVGLMQENRDDDHGVAGIRRAHKATVLRGHKGPVMALAFSPKCDLLATGGLDSTVSVWSLGNPPRDVAVLRESLLGDVHVLAFDPRGDYLITGSASLDARMLKWSWRQSLNRDRTAIEGPSFSEALAFSADGQSLVSAVGSSIWMWSIADGAIRKRMVLRNQSGDVKALKFSPDGRHLVSGDSAGIVQFWKLGWLGIRPGNELTAHRSGITCLAFSHDGQYLASASIDHSICIWDGSGGVSREKAVLRANARGVIRQMMFLPNAKLLLTVADSGHVVLWSWSDGLRQHEWKLEQPIICSLAVASDGCLVAAGSTDGTATLYDLVPESLQ